jgi:hypothetical protein
MHCTRTTSILVLGAALVATACGREQDEPPSNDTTGGNETAEGTESPEGPESTAGVTTTAVTTTVGSTVDSTEDSGGEDCEGRDGCYACAPTTPVQVLDACTDATCEPFPNTTRRLPLLEPDGSLPPLP